MRATAQIEMIPLVRSIAPVTALVNPFPRADFQKELSLCYKGTWSVLSRDSRRPINQGNTQDDERSANQGSAGDRFLQ